jgi:hypothetical protein
LAAEFIRDERPTNQSSFLFTYSIFFPDICYRMNESSSQFQCTRRSFQGFVIFLLLFFSFIEHIVRLEQLQQIVRLRVLWDARLFREASERPSQIALLKERIHGLERMVLDIDSPFVIGLRISGEL